MLSYGLICLAVICMAVMFSAIFKRGIEQTLPLAVMLIILIVYASGLLKLVKIGFFAALILSFICMVLSVFISIGQGNALQLIRNIFTVGFAVFLIMSVLLFFLSENMTLSETDLSGYTASFIRSILQGQGFSAAPVSKESGIGMQPGFAVFVYMFTALKGSFSETDVIRGSGFFMLVMILPIFGKIKWENAFMAIPAAALLAGAIYVGGTYVPVWGALNPVSAAMVVFAMMLVTYMCCEQCGYVYWTLGFGNAMLCLICPGSEILAILMFVIILIDIAALGFWEITELFATASKWISVIFYFLITALTFMSWWIYAGRHGIGRLFYLINMSSERTLGFGGRLGQVFRALAGGRSLLPYLLWLVVIAMLGAGAALLSDGFWNKIRTGIQSVIVLFGLIMFIFALAFAYTYVFPVSTNIKTTVDMFITGYIVAALIFAVNMLFNKIMDRFFTS